MIECLSEDAVLDLIEGRLDGALLEDVTTHLDACIECRELVSGSARDLDGETDTPRAVLARGASVGRYVIIDPIGAGSMGAIYTAYDPELDRKVALKLLRPDAFAAGPAPELRARLLREAQALARLSHPNVITVFDVGTFEGEVFIAMEYLEGGTLGAHLRAAQRPIPEVMDLFRQAGEGLAAAHEAGVVHRDFKPENVLIGKDGRVRVSDFGLARASGSAAGVLGDEALADLPAATMTRTGAVVGTPAYMAPEQWSGKSVDARADVFAFSVALYEALHGERPFAGDTFGEVADAVAQNRVRPPRKNVPAPIRRALLRGLRADPEERYPSMRALLEDLRPPRRRGLAMAAAAMVLALGAAGFGLMQRTSATHVCAGASEAWGDAYRARDQAEIERAFTATGEVGAGFTAAAASQALASYRDTWIAMRTEACQATRIRGIQSEALLDVRMTCLDARRSEAAALVEALRHADRKTVANAVSAVGSLTSIAECARATTLLAPDPPPADPARRRDHDALSAELARVKALADVRRFDECHTAMTALWPRIEALGYRPLAARSLFLQGLCVPARPDRALKVEILQRAVTTAIEARQDDVAVDAWLLLIEASTQNDKLEEAHLWDRYAAAGIARLGGDDEREALRETRVGGFEYFREHKIDEPRARLERARALFVKTHGEHHFRVAQVDEMLANLLFEQRRYEEARALHRRVYATRAESLGPDTPALATSLTNEGVCIDNMGHPEEALAIFEEVLRRFPMRDSMFLRARMAHAHRNRKDWAAALASDRLALEKGEAERALPVDRMPVLAGEGLDLIGLGRARDAIVPLEEAALIGTGDDDMGEVWFPLGRALWDGGGDRARAVDLVQRARAQTAHNAERWRYATVPELAEMDRWLAEHVRTEFQR